MNKIGYFVKCTLQNSKKNTFFDKKNCTYQKKAVPLHREIKNNQKYI